MRADDDVDDADEVELDDDDEDEVLLAVAALVDDGAAVLGSAPGAPPLPLPLPLAAGGEFRQADDDEDELTLAVEALDSEQLADEMADEVELVGDTLQGGCGGVLEPGAPTTGFLSSCWPGAEPAGPTCCCCCCRPWLWCCCCG